MPTDDHELLVRAPQAANEKTRGRERCPLWVPEAELSTGRRKRRCAEGPALETPQANSCRWPLMPEAVTNNQLNPASAPLIAIRKVRKYHATHSLNPAGSVKAQF